MFGNLTEKLANAFKKFKNKGKLTEADVKAGMREIKLALLEGPLIEDSHGLHGELALEGLGVDHRVSVEAYLPHHGGSPLGYAEGHDNAVTLVLRAGGDPDICVALLEVQVPDGPLVQQDLALTKDASLLGGDGLLQLGGPDAPVAGEP